MWVALDLRTWITRCLVAFRKYTKRSSAQRTSLTTELALRSSSCVGGVAMTLIRLSVKFSQGSRLRSDSVWMTGLHDQDLVPLLWRRDGGQVVTAVLVEIQIRKIKGHRKKEVMMPSPKEHSMARQILISIKCPSELYEPQLRPPEIPEAQPDGPLATQQTLVNSPINVRSRSAARTRFTAEVVLAAPMSSQATVVAQPLRAAWIPPSRRGRAEREVNPAAEVPTPTADAQSSQQVRRTRSSSKFRGLQLAVTPSDAPYHHTRARSRSVDLPPQSAPPSRSRRVVSAKMKSKEKELEEVPEEDAEHNMNKGSTSPVRISEKPVSSTPPELSLDVRESAQNETHSAGRSEKSSGGAQILGHLPETLQEEEDVQNLLEGPSLFTDNEDEAPSDKSSHRGRQEFSVDSSSDEPSDSDDASTHRKLHQTPEPLSEASESDEPQEHSGQLSLKRQASSGLRLSRGQSRIPNTLPSAPNNPPTMTTRSSANHVTRQRAPPPLFPSPKTKARTLYEAKQREKRSK
ncbi:hypothetical protein K503DRAFT_230053 [Rhizopogon vinicolor AM-OR11-026]|uniref:Uncharacterized protein n=1 Tax=Rhizopogon vinicolor AM-OR11-026 TaxID=1314800 RepID=A0A1B7MY22_9AGAM|nr:hypothetical protein K503DRAFT_230053 [Rhizopogon vinicolor AM-OR11-026]